MSYRTAETLAKFERHHQSTKDKETDMKISKGLLETLPISGWKGPYWVRRDDARDELEITTRSPQEETEMKREEVAAFQDERLKNTRFSFVNQLQRLADRAYVLGFPVECNELTRVAERMQEKMSKLAPPDAEETDPVAAVPSIEELKALYPANASEVKPIDLEGELAHLAPDETALNSYLEQIRKYATNKFTHGHSTEANELFAICGALSTVQRRLNDLEEVAFPPENPER